MTTAPTKSSDSLQSSRPPMVLHYLRNRWLLLAMAAALILTVAAAFSWNWLAAAGLATVLLTVLPCLLMCGLMCAVGLCSRKFAGNSGPTQDATSTIADLPDASIEARRRRMATVAAVAAVALAIPAAIILSQFGRSTEPAYVAIGGPFQLVDQDGRSVTDKTFAGKPSVIFFGYTSCPDICPTTLMDLSNWLKALGPAANKLNILFISIDPARDTPAHVRDYLSSFDPRIRGLTGTNDQVAAVAREYRVYYKRIDEKDGNYTMDHSGAMYLMNSAGRFVAPLSWQTEDSLAIERLRTLAAS
jgi:protein SCO1/2